MNVNVIGVRHNDEGLEPLDKYFKSEYTARSLPDVILEENAVMEPFTEHTADSQDGEHLGSEYGKYVFRRARDIGAKLFTIDGTLVDGRDLETLLRYKISGKSAFEIVAEDRAPYQLDYDFVSYQFENLLMRDKLMAAQTAEYVRLNPSDGVELLVGVSHMNIAKHLEQHHEIDASSVDASGSVGSSKKLFLNELFNHTEGEYNERLFGAFLVDTACEMLVALDDASSADLPDSLSGSNVDSALKYMSRRELRRGHKSRKMSKEDYNEHGNLQVRNLRRFIEAIS